MRHTKDGMPSLNSASSASMSATPSAPTGNDRIAGGSSDGVVLDRTYYKTPPRRHGVDGDGIRLGPAGCEDQVLRPRPEPGGNHLARVFHDASRGPARLMDR